MRVKTSEGRGTGRQARPHFYGADPNFTKFMTKFFSKVAQNPFFRFAKLDSRAIFSSAKTAADLDRATASSVGCVALAFLHGSVATSKELHGHFTATSQELHTNFAATSRELHTNFTNFTSLHNH